MTWMLGHCRHRWDCNIKMDLKVIHTLGGCGMGRLF
jgi:hypothetical protein